MSDRLLLIGCGNMAGAMLAGWLGAGLARDRFAVLDPGLREAPEGVALYSTPGEVPDDHNAVLLGFKPQQLADLAPGLQRITGNGVQLHSLLGGITLSQLRGAFPMASAHLRVMPNLAVRINKSPVLLAHTGFDEGACDSAFSLYNALGTAVWLDDETRFDLLTALSGSGPGFVYRFIDALVVAAQRLGAERDQAQRLALAMVEGASLLAASSECAPGELAERVASPGGMTREGLNVLDAQDALVDLLVNTLAATARRGGELSEGA